MKNNSGVVASIHSGNTMEHKFNIEITLEKASIILSGILSGSKSYGGEKLTILKKKILNFTKKHLDIVKIILGKKKYLSSKTLL